MLVIQSCVFSSSCSARESLGLHPPPLALSRTLFFPSLLAAGYDEPRLAPKAVKLLVANAQQLLGAFWVLLDMWAAVGIQQVIKNVGDLNDALQSRLILNQCKPKTTTW